MRMSLLALWAVVVGAASVAMAAPCAYRGQPFAEGDVSCQDGRQFRCAGGKWSPIGTECADTDPGDAGVEVRPGVTEPACPVGTKSCSTCHMPKTELPGAHIDFTDHRIRIVRKGEPFPP